MDVRFVVVPVAIACIAVGVTSCSNDHASGADQRFCHVAHKLHSAALEQHEQIRPGMSPRELGALSGAYVRKYHGDMEWMLTHAPEEIRQDVKTTTLPVLQGRPLRPSEVDDAKAATHRITAYLERNC